MNTIRGRILLLFACTMIFGGVLTVLHYTNMLSLKEKMVMIGDFDNLLNNILELRRFEKNSIYYKDEASINSWIDYLARVEEACRNHCDDIGRVVGSEESLRFKEELKNYEDIMRKEIAAIQEGGGTPYVDEIRDKGKFLVEFAQNLILIKRQNIDKSLSRMLVWPVLYFLIFVILTVMVFQLINKSILKPLYLIRKATKQVGQETFTPIEYAAKQRNEIAKLIYAFNRMAQQLETRQEQLLQSRKMVSIGTFTSGIAHELNNPLNNISLTAETLLMGYEEVSPEETRELYEEILLQAERASQVVKNLLEFSRVERPFMSRLDIGEVLDKTLKLAKNQFVIKGIHLEKRIDEGLPPIKGKQHELENAFLNIIINAVQAMPGKGTITVGAGLVDQDHLRIDISDTGVGIKPSDLEHIFDPFYTTKEVGKGTGLGLSLVYGIIRTHGGYIEVNSRVNEGTTFSILLPIDKDDPENSGETV